jgi:hypothetical protein
LLIELITVAVMDACSALRERHAATLDQETARLRAEVEAERDRKVAAAQDAQQSALDKFHGAEAALADARDKIEHLSAVVGNDDEPASEKPEPKKPSAKKKPTPAKAAA